MKQQKNYLKERGLNINDIAAAVAMSLAGFGLGFGVGIIYMLNKMETIIMRLLEQSGAVINPDILNELVQIGMRRLGI